MKDNQQIPGSRFKEAEADLLIANYGVKRPDDNRLKVKDSLRGLRKDFLAVQKERERSRSGPDRII